MKSGSSSSFSRMKAILLLPLSCLVWPHAVAREAGEFVISGSIDGATVHALRQGLEGVNPPRSVTFRDCLGGDTGPSLELAGLIRDRRLPTYAEGQVNSGCHLAFLGGIERRLSAKMTTAMLVHAPSKAGKPVSEQALTLLFTAMSLLTDGRFPGKYREEIPKYHVSDEGLMFVSEPRGNGMTRQSVHVCKRPPTDERSTCTRHADVSFAELGFITRP